MPRGYPINHPGPQVGHQPWILRNGWKAWASLNTRRRSPKTTSISPFSASSRRGPERARHRLSRPPQAAAGRDRGARRDGLAEPKTCRSHGSPAGERRQVTILFADLSGFTAISRTLDPEEVRELVGRYTALVDGIVVGYGGTVDKHIGDAVMALFGAPVRMATIRCAPLVPHWTSMTHSAG